MSIFFREFTETNRASNAAQEDSTTQTDHSPNDCEAKSLPSNQV